MLLSFNDVIYINQLTIFKFHIELLLSYDRKLPHCHIYCEQLYKFGKEILTYANRPIAKYVRYSLLIRREFHIRSKDIIIPKSGHTVKSAMRCWPRSKHPSSWKISISSSVELSLKNLSLVHGRLTEHSRAAKKTTGGAQIAGS